MTSPGCASDSAVRPDVPRSVNRATHCLTGADYLPSPNCDPRPVPTSDIALLVIHNISLPPDQFGAGPRGPGSSYIDELFLNRLDPAVHPYFKSIQALRVSSHLCIFRDGGIRQYVPFDQRAWHAGVSQWRGRERCNDFSIGIELEGSDTTVFTDAQYTALTDTTRALLRAYPGLGLDAITGHSDIAPGRKTDPGPCFDWPRYRHALEETHA